MTNRRKFISTAVTGMAGLTLLPAINTFANNSNEYSRNNERKVKLRFALASDLHYGQEGTDSALNAGNIVKWLNEDHAKNHLDMVIINGDLVHNRPDLLPEVKSKYFDKLDVPYYTIPGNHDFADAAIWKNVFGYEDKFTVEHGDIAFVFANTADTKGVYVCPDNAFIKASLDKFTSKKIVFVILHIAPVQWLKTEVNIFLNCPETVELLHAYPNVKAAFHGHDHSLDGVRYTDKLPHFFDSHTGGNWGTDYKGYRIVEVGEDYQIYTYQVNASQNPVLNETKF
ncbi:MAG: metallophosphoesterase [Mucilaginibacter sp.]|nr:metallophosphoesterase [Mucilaginibacter sp.]